MNARSLIMLIHIVIIAILFSLLPTACYRSQDEWTGFFYPDGNFFRERKEGPFSTKDECLRWARSQAKSLSDDYECGSNCKSSNGEGPMICEETVDS